MKWILYFLASLLMMSNVFAWGPDGHKIVAQIAEDQLSPLAKSKIKQLLNDASLASVSIWADTIKGDPSWDHARPWHFVDIPDGEDYETSDHHPEGDIIVAITEMVQILKSSSSTLLEKQNALKFIIHFVGDIHQPLHVGRPDDRGGNSVKVVFNGRTMNLHSLWDGAMITVQKMDYQTYARHLQGTKLVAAAYDIAELPFSDIVKEDMGSRKEIYNFKGLSGPVVLDHNYMKRNLETMNLRLLKGGQRLASLLNTLYGQ